MDHPSTRHHVRTCFVRRGVAAAMLGAVGGALFLAAPITATAGQDEPPVSPTPVTEPDPRVVPIEPPLPPGEHPVVVHDCGVEGGYEVDEWVDPAPDPDRDVDLHAIEIYETSSDHSFGYHPMGAADVFVHATSRPQVLVLRANEPTMWRIHPDAGVVIQTVYVDGYRDQVVVGTSDATTVIDISEQETLGGGEPDEDFAAPAFTSETYCYHASMFSIRPDSDETEAS